MDNDVIYHLPVVIPLVYDDTVAVDSYERILFVHTAASNLQTFANSTTFTIVYDYSSTLEEVFLLIRRKFSLIKRVGFAFHNNGDLTQFLKSETWFSDADLEESQTVFSKNAQFMLDFLQNFSVVNVDFLACRTLQSEKWRRFFEVLHLETGVIVGASENDTGNLKCGGVESTMEDIRDMYFNGGINWAGLLIPLPLILCSPLIFLSDISTANMTNVVLIDSGIPQFQSFVNDKSFAIVYEPDSSLSDLIGLLRMKFFSIERIAVVSHYNAEPRFLGSETLFNPSGVSSFSKNTQGLIDILKEFNVTHIDFLACKTLTDSNWTAFYSVLQTHVVVGASIDDTGNLKYGGNWTMENTQEDVKQVYFNSSSIDNYASLLATTTITYSFGTLTYTYTEGINTAAVSGTGTLVGAVTIPEKINIGGADYKVTSFAAFSSASCANVTSIVIFARVTSIPNSAFSSLGNLLTVTFPDTVTTIGTNCFALCQKLTAFNWPPLLTVIPGGFMNMSLYNITFNTAIIIPNTITSIGSYAFNGLQNVPSVYIPPNCTIATNAISFLVGANNITCYGSGELPSPGFMYNTALASLTFWAGITSISSGSLTWSSSGLTSLTLPSTLVSFDMGALTECMSLKTLTIPLSVTTITSTVAFGPYSPTNLLITFLHETNFPTVSLPKLPTNSTILVSKNVIAMPNYQNKVIVAGTTITQLGRIRSVVTFASPYYNVVSVSSFQSNAVSWQYSINSGSTWTTLALTTTSFNIPDDNKEYAIHTIQVRTTDVAGNTSLAITNESAMSVRIWTQPAFSISGTPTQIPYSPSKMVNLTTAISFSGGATNISPIYSIPLTGAGMDYTISGTTLTYQNIGNYPVRLSISGGLYYIDDVSANTIISIVPGTLSNISISGTPATQTYNSSNKNFDLSSIIFLTGGVAGISTTYSVSGTGLDYSICGTILTYTNSGKYPIKVSISGGTNYTPSNLVADISINKAQISLTASGAPLLISSYSALNKTVDLTQISLSGGAVDLTPVYTVSGSTGGYSISGSILTYQNIGKFPIAVSMSGSNYTNTIRVGIDISVNQSELSDLSISGDPVISTYTLSNKKVDLTSVLTLSGGAPDISAIYTISGVIGLVFSISGSILTYQNAGNYPIIVSMSGGTNYSNNKFVKNVIRVNPSSQSDLTISGIPGLSTYTFSNKTVNLPSKISMSGGAADISPIYTAASTTDFTYSISGTTLYYKNTGTYPLIVSISGGTNYSNDVSAGTDITVNRSSLLPLSILGTPNPQTYTYPLKVIDLTTVFSLGGGATDISAVYTVSGADTGLTISGTTLYYTFAGNFPITVSMSGGMNYDNDVLVGTDISINKGTLSDISISGAYQPSTYTLSSKTVELTSVLSISGGAPDVSLIYSVSGSIGGYSISGTTLYYENAGIYPIAISMTGGPNYWNNKTIGFDISVNKAALSDLSISGEPRVSTYNLQNKTVDLTTVLTLSGGAQDISAVYTISGGTNLIFSISGTILTYTDVGLYPIIVSSTGGKNYWNNVSVKTDIRVNQSTLQNLTISGSPTPTPYTLADKIVDLRTVISLSGGATDLSAIYSASSTTDFTYSISGTYLAYDTVGTYPLIVSMSKSKNYFNDVQVETAIEITKPGLPDIYVVGTPEPVTYNHSSKTVDLLSIVFLSGGAEDVSAIYSVTGDNGCSISGTTFTYTNAGKFPIVVSMFRGMNYSNDVFAYTDISINQARQAELSISGSPEPSVYNVLNKSIDLTSVLTLSGGAVDISAVYTISGGTGLEFSISGTILYYKDVGTFPIIVSMSGGKNYWNDVSVKTDISVNQAALTDLSISGEPEMTEYNLRNKTVDLTRILTLSGGAQDISAVYSISGGTDLIFSISGTILTYTDVGLYPIIVSSMGGKNYWNDESVKTNIRVNQSTLLDLTISGEPIVSEYTLSNRTVDLTRVLTLSGGALDISAVYTISGETGLDFSISGTILTYKDIGLYPIIVSMAGGKNYSNNKFVKTDISVNQSTLLELSISGEPRVSEYTLLNKSVDLTSVLTLSGGAADIYAVYTISGGTGLEYSISGSILYYEDVGLYPVIVSMSGGTNYSNNMSVKTDISVNRTRLDDIFVLGTPETTPYTLSYKYVDLSNVLTLSGGAADLSFIYSVSSSYRDYSISGSILTYKDAGTYPIIVSMSRGKNYLDDVSKGTAIVIDQVEQPELTISGIPEPITYTLSNKTVDLTTVLTFSGGAPDLRSTVIYSVSGASSYSISGTILTYENAGRFPIAVSISGGKNYSNNVRVETDISINKDFQPAVFVVGTPLPSTFQTPNKTVDLTSVLTLSGGAPDLSSTVIYSVSGENTTYSISGSTLTYENAGLFPISISISGGKNYWNDVFTGTDISINKANVPLSISGTPASYVFSHFSRTVALSSAISLSGGSPDVSAVFSGPNVNNGSTLIYTDVSSYPVYVTVSGGINYTDTSASTFISITKATIPLSISGTPTTYTFDPLNKTIILSQTISLSGGALNTVPSFSGANVNGSILTYTDVSSYPVLVTVSGGINYTDTFASTFISITKATIPLSISGTSVTYSSSNKNVLLSSSTILLSGGAPGVDPIYSGTAVNDGSTLTYTNAGSYIVNVSVPGGRNYTDTSASTLFSVTKATIPLSVSATSSAITFHPVNKNVSLLTAISLSGGAQDVSARYTGIGVHGSILTYTDTGSYLVYVTVSGGDNYTDTSASTMVIITKATQPSFVLNSYNVIYDPRSKSTNLSGRGSGGVEGATTTFSGDNVAGTILTYTTVGDFSVTATKSYPNYFDSIPQNYTVTVMNPDPTVGATADELKAAGYSLSDLFGIAYTTTGLLSAGYLVAELKEGVLAYGGFTEAQLTTLGYTALQLQTAAYTAAELKSVGFTISQLFDLGYTTTTLLAAGYTDSELKTVILLAGGLTSTQLTALGYTALQLQNAGYTVTELKYVGYTIPFLFNLGFTVTKLSEAGYTQAELKTAVVATGGLTAAQLNALAYTASQLQEQEYTKTELTAAGYTLIQLYTAGYTTGALYDAGYNATDIQNSVPTAGYTIPELRAIGFGASQLKPAGYFLSPLVDGGFTAQNLKDALFSPAELLTHFPAEELYPIFTTPREKATVTKAVVADLFSPTISKVSGLSVESMVGYTFSELVTDVTAVVSSDPLTPTTFRISDFNNGSTAIYAIIDVSGSSVIFPTQNTHVTIVNIGNETYRVYDASGAIFQDNLVIGNKVTVDGLTVAIGSVVAFIAILTVSQLISKGFTTAEKLVDASYTAAKLELAGYTAMHLEIAGFTAKILIAVGYTAIQLQTAGYNATRLQTAGFTSTDLESVGYTEPLLRVAKYRAAQLLTAGYTATQLRLAGYSVTELQSIGYTAAQLQAAGFSRAQKQVKPAWLSTNSNNITFPERNEILCHATTVSGETVTTLEGFKTCVLQFSRPGFETNYTCYIEKRYATVTLYSNVLNAETYALTFRTRNIAGNLTFLVSFELNGIVIKTDTMVDGKLDSFSMILHENYLTVLIDDLQWFISPRKSTCIYKTKFNLNHDKTNIKNISFVYFQNATNQISYTIPANLPSLTANSFAFDYLEGAIRDLRDISAGGPTLTLHVQNMNYDLTQNNPIPVISTLIHSENMLSSNAYTTRIYLSKDATQGTLYDVMLSDTSANTQAKLILGKTVKQKLRYVNSDGSGQVLSDIQVYID